MYLSSVKLVQFKNYAEQALNLSPRLNCFTGLNGMGKTNLLDAVHYLCLTKNHNGLSDKQLIQRGKDFFRLEGRFETEEGAAKVVAKYQTGGKKEIEKNGVPFDRISDFVGQFPVIIIAPDDVDLVQDGSEERRRFMDAVLSQIDAHYLRQLILYNHLLKQRNALLKRFAAENRFDPDWLEAVDRQIPAPARDIAERRIRFVETIQPLFQDYYAAISGGRESVGLSLDADLITDPGKMEELLKESLEKDRLLERTSRGPHRDDLTLTMEGLPVKKTASQGQLKSYLLAMKLAQYELLRREKGTTPILLLDDIFDKLDAQRVHRLIGLLTERKFGQLFITDTQKERIESIVSSFGEEYVIFEVEEGNLT